MHTINVDGKEYRLQFRHIHFGQDIGVEACAERLTDVFREAFKAGQVKLHAYYEEHDDEMFTPCIIAISLNGATVCYVEDEDRNVLSTGYSFCSVNDQFDKKRGRQIAMGRALRGLK